jgi:hypothetical protein
MLEKFFLDQVHQPAGVVYIEAGHAHIQWLVGGDGQEGILLLAKELRVLFLAKDLDLGLIVLFEPLR